MLKKTNNLTHFITLSFTFLLLLSPSSVLAEDSVIPPSENTKQIQVNAENVEYFHEQQKVVGTGKVSINYEGDLLTADKITVFMASKKAFAEGHVELIQKDLSFKGASAEYDFAKKIGNVSKMNAQIGPTVFVKADNVQRVSEDHFKADKISLTTCCSDTPFYRVESKQVDIYPNDKVVMKNAVIYIHNTPVFFVPVYVQPVFNTEKFPIQVVPGKNSKWGFFALTKWRYHLVDKPALSSKGNLLADFREKRGTGLGAENFYRGEKIGRGAIRTYYTHDQRPSEEADKERFRGQWRHQTRLTEDTTLTFELNKLSDPTIIKDFFFREEYERSVAPENYISLITAKPEYTFSILERKRLDDFFSTVERNPEIRFDTHTRPFLETPFYLRQEYQYSNLERKVAGSDDGINVNRFDVNQTMYYPGRIGALSVVPRVGTRQTYYTRDIEGDRERSRGAFDPGLDLSTRFYKTYNASAHRMGLDWNGIRHIFNPTASYFYRPNPTTPRTMLQQFDSVDAIDKQNFIRFSLDNKVQTKTHTGPDVLESRELARIIPFFDTDMHTGRLENIGITAEFRPYTWLGIDSDATYDNNTRDITAANLDVYVNRSNTIIGVGQRYTQDESSQTTVSARYRLNKEWAFKVYERYEFETNTSKEFEVGVSKSFDCWIMDFTYNRRESDSFYVTVRLNGYPDSSFNLDQSYEHPRAPVAGITTTPGVVAP